MARESIDKLACPPVIFKNPSAMISPPNKAQVSLCSALAIRPYGFDKAEIRPSEPKNGPCGQGFAFGPMSATENPAATKSGGFAVVIVEQPAQARKADHGAVFVVRAFIGDGNPPSKSLVQPLVVVELLDFTQSVMQSPLPNVVAAQVVLDGAHDSFGVGVHIGMPGADDLDLPPQALISEHSPEGAFEQRVTVEKEGVRAGHGATRLQVLASDFIDPFGFEAAS